jgi:hypothetical protein
MNTNKNLKAIWIATVVILTVSVALALAGSICMFLDEYATYSYGYYSSERVYYQCPESGIMPLIGTVLALTGLVMFGISLKKNKKLSIGTIVLVIVGQILLFTSIIYIHSGIGFIGWYVCFSGALLMSVAVILCIVYMVLAFQKKSTQNSQTYANKDISVFNKCADALVQIKVLKDEGILTDTEFETQKQVLFDRYNITSAAGSIMVLDGQYISEAIRISIKGTSYVLEIAEKIVKSGDIEYDIENKNVTLLSSTGEMLLNIEGNCLISQKGVIFKKSF